MTKCESHEEMIKDVATTKSDITHIKESIGVLFKKFDKLVVANYLIIFLLLIAIGEKLLPYVTKLAFAGE